MRMIIDAAKKGWRIGCTRAHLQAMIRRNQTGLRKDIILVRKGYDVKFKLMNKDDYTVKMEKDMLIIFLKGISAEDITESQKEVTARLTTASTLETVKNLWEN